MENNEDLNTQIDEPKSKEDILNKKITDASKNIKNVIDEVHKKVVWQDNLIKSMIIWLLSKWHILI